MLNFDLTNWDPFPGDRGVAVADYAMGVYERIGDSAEAYGSLAVLEEWSSRNGRNARRFVSIAIRDAVWFHRNFRPQVEIDPAMWVRIRTLIDTGVDTLSERAQKGSGRSRRPIGSGHGLRCRLRQSRRRRESGCLMSSPTLIDQRVRALNEREFIAARDLNRALDNLELVRISRSGDEARRHTLLMMKRAEAELARIDRERAKLRKVAQP
jgi:hypothetical protein